MPSTIGLVTDSNSQITAELVSRFAVEVVPLTVTVDDVEHLEGVDLDADAFYEMFADGASPTVSTSQPSPGRFMETYRRLSDRGCTEIVSVHLSESMSGTIASAMLAARDAAVPVHVIDTGSASFGVGVCVWAAGLAIERGDDVDLVRSQIEGLTPRIGTVFIAGVPHLVERGGRAADIDIDGDGIAVLAMSGGAIEVLDRVTTVEDTVDVMSSYAAAWGDDVTVGIGTADAPSRNLTERLVTALRDLGNVAEIVHYRVGPSVGAHTGPGTFGLFVFPTLR